MTAPPPAIAQTRLPWNRAAGCYAASAMGEVWDEITIDAAGLRIAARVTGAGETIVCLHGWLDNAASFEPLGAALHGFRVVAVDLPGHGLSSHREPGNSYAFVDTVAAMAAARDALGLDRCILMGHSLGAAVASALAGAQPGRCDALVLLEGIAPLTEAPEHAALRLGRALDEQRTKLGRRPPVYRDAEFAAERLSSSISNISLDAARILCSRGLVDAGEGVTWRSDPQVRWQSRVRMVEDQVLALLRAIRCPTLLVRGEDSRFVDGPMMDGRVAAIAGIEVARLPGGHHLHLEHPGAAAAVVARFLAPWRQP